MEVKSDLSKVQEGDRLVSVQKGEVTVHAIVGEFIHAENGYGVYIWDKQGHFHPGPGYCRSVFPDLYYPGVQIIPAEPPKRKKKVTVEKWIGLYVQDSYGNIAPCVRSTLEEFAYPERMIGEPQRVTWEIEVEDD